MAKAMLPPVTSQSWREGIGWERRREEGRERKERKGREKGEMGV